MSDLLSNEKNPPKLTINEILFKGTIIAVLIIIPSLSAFFLFWIISGELLNAIIIGAIVHFIAMGFSLKISKKFFSKERHL